MSWQVPKKQSKRDSIQEGDNGRRNQWMNQGTTNSSSACQLCKGEMNTLQACVHMTVGTRRSCSESSN